METKVRRGVDLRSIGPIYGVRLEFWSVLTPHLRPRNDEGPVKDHSREVCRVSQYRPHGYHPSHAVANHVEGQVGMFLLDNLVRHSDTQSAHLHYHGVLNDIINVVVHVLYVSPLAVALAVADVVVAEH